MFCAKCGIALPRNPRFCPECGEQNAAFTQSESPVSLTKPAMPEDNRARSASEPVSYAGFWIRLAATFYDSLIMFIPALIAGFALALASPALLVKSPGTEAALNLFSIILGWLYAALMESSAKQATLGKMLLKIKVTDLSGNPISFGKASGRYFGKIVSYILLGIGFFMAGWTEKKQGLHDKMAGCLVVNRETKGRTVWVVVAFFFMILIPVGGIVAAVSIPALMTYEPRSQVSAVVLQLNATKAPLAAWYASHGHWPREGVDIQATDPGKYLESLDLSQSGPDATTPDLVVTATFKSEGVADALKGKTLHLSTTDGGTTWKCSRDPQDGVDVSYLPVDCR
ncbi:MAG: RDD family protein [Magnetococcus sp. DMHC-1]|nr:RDD family protein [Magnetococcales bacterium]